MLLRRTVIAALSATALAGLAHAQAPAFPTRPVTMVVPFPAGGITDTIARALAQKMGDTLGQSVIVDNKPGGGGQIAATQVKQAAADGHTVFVGATEMFAINQNLFRKFSYDPLRDFTPISSLIASPLVLVVPANSPVNSVNDLVQQAKTRKGGMNFASQGIGSIGHLLGELFRGQTGGEYNHVAYKGSAPALQDVMAGQVDMMFDPVITTAPLIAGKKLKPLAIAAAKRSPQLPDVPTLAELGFKGLEDTPFYGIWAPKGTPTTFINGFSQALDKVVAMPDVRKSLTDMGLTVGYMSPQQLDKRERAYTQVWSRIIKDSGFQPQ